MQTLTSQERIDLGALLAKLQTLVLRVFKNGIDPTNETGLEIMVNDILISMSQASQKLRFHVVEGTEACISVLSEKYQSAAKNASESAEAVKIARTLHDAITRAIEKVVENDRVADSFEFTPSRAA